MVTIKWNDWQPSASDLAWCRAHMAKGHDFWGCTSGELYECDHKNKTLTLISGPHSELHERNKIAFGKIGYKVV